MRTEREEWEREDRLRGRPTGELVGDLVHEAQLMLRDEVRLAGAELREEARRAARGGAALGAGAAILYGAYLMAAATLIIVFATFLPLWLSALIWTVVFAVIGGAALQYGRSKLKETRPQRAVEQLREDGRWASETMRDIRSRRGASA